MKIGSYKATYLNADDIRKPMLITVRKVQEEKVGTAEKLVLYTDELDQGIALGKTTLLQLEEIFESDDTDNWEGNQCVVFNDTSVIFQGKQVGGIRFRKAKNGAAKPLVHKKSKAETPDQDTDVPF